MNDTGYILVNGDVNCDVLITIPENGMQNAKPLELALGGTGGNSAVAFARLGMPCKMMGTSGQDYYGRFILNTLQQEMVDTSAMYISPSQASSQVIILLDREGGVVGDFPLGDQIDANITEKERLVIANARWVHTVGCAVSSAITRKRLLELVDTAIQNNVPYSIDINLRFHAEMGTSTALEALRQAIHHARVVLGSAQEFLYLEPGGSFIEAAQRLLADKGQTAIVRNGADGAYGVVGGRTIHVPAFQVPVRDTLGAGDVFNAGFLLAYLEEHELKDCLRWGNAAAALHIMRTGGRRGGATRQQLIHFLESQITDKQIN